MKKFLLSMVALFALCCCFAAKETVDIPAMGTWNSDGKVEFVNQNGGWYLKDGVLLIPGKYPASYGDCVLITMRHAGKGKMIVRLSEHSADGKLLSAYNYNTFLNSTGKEQTYSPTYDICNKDVKYYTLTVEAANNPGMVIKDFKVGKAYGAVQKIYSPILAADHWNEVTKGENLAKGTNVEFDTAYGMALANRIYIREPNHVPTRQGGTDATDLTDGKLSKDHRGYIYDDKAAVGWTYSRWMGKVGFTLDLGTPQPVEKVVMRICGGRRNMHLGGSAGMFPNLIEVWISRDKKDWYKASSLQKLQINEKDDADWKTLYYLPEGNTGTPPYVYPFQLNVNAEARYIYVNFETSYYIFAMDEVAVLKGKTQTDGFNAVYNSAPVDIFKKQAVMTPSYSSFYVPRNVNVPNFLNFSDKREVKPDNELISYSFDLPEQIEYIPEEPLKFAYQAETRQLAGRETQNGRTVFHFTQPHKYSEFVGRANYKIGPFYFRAKGDVPEKEQYLKLTTFGDGKEIGSIKMKLNVIEIPEVPRLKHLLAAGTWFTSRVMYSWPDAMKSVRHIGLNALSVHDQITPQNEGYLKAARANGFKIIGVPDNFFVNQWRKIPELHCTNFGKVSTHNHICPAYRGKYYQELCDDVVGKRMKELAPDYIHLDFEFYFSPDTFATCSRCETLRKSKNMTRAQYAEWACADSYKRVLLAAKKAAPNAKIGSYLYCADRVAECDGQLISLFGAKQLFPEYLDELHTVYYGVNVRFVQKAVRTNYLYVHDPQKVLIYLSAGSGAYFTDEYGPVTFYSILEAYMNGAYGIAYFVDRSLTSPIDYYYLACGLKAVAPYEEFLIKATLDEKFKGSNPYLSYTLRRLGKDALVLVGNYGSRKEAVTSLSLPGLKLAVDCLTGKSLKIRKDGIDLNVGKDNVRFLKLTFQ